MAIRILLVLWLVIAACAHAGESTEELAMRFVRLLAYADQYRDYHRACLSTATTVSPESLVRDNPDRFGGIRPGSTYWPSVVSAYQEYVREMCAHPTESEYLAAIARAYARDLTTDELKAAIDFYSAPLGRRLIAAHSTAAANVYADWVRLNAQHAPEIDRKFDRTLNALVEKAFPPR